MKCSKLIPFLFILLLGCVFFDNPTELTDSTLKGSTKLKIPENIQIVGAFSANRETGEIWRHQAITIPTWYTIHENIGFSASALSGVKLVFGLEGALQGTEISFDFELDKNELVKTFPYSFHFYKNGELYQSFDLVHEFVLEIDSSSIEDVWEMYFPPDFNIYVNQISDPTLGSFIQASHQEERPKLVVIGDSKAQSLVVSTPKNSDQTWPVILAKESNSDLYNLGVSGSATNSLFLESLPEDVDLLLIELGVNDFLVGRSLEEFRDSYSNLIQLALQDVAADKIRCITPISYEWRAESGATQRNTTELTKIRGKITQICEAVNIEVIQGQDLTSTANLAFDGLHFSDSGAFQFANDLNLYLIK